MSRVRTRVKRPAWYVHRHAYVYTIPVQDPRTGAYETYGYIGQTARTWFTGNVRTDLAARYLEHREEQPWRDQIRSPYMLVIWRGSCTQADLDRRERAAILAYRPLYNVEHNLRNPRRIKPWDVKPARGRVRTFPLTYLALLALGTVVFLSIALRLS
jgi:hypothetical protein